MKKFVSIVLTLVLVLGIAIPASATSIGNIAADTMVQPEIDAIFTELNEMAAEEKMLEILVEEDEENIEKLAAVKAQNNLRKQTYEKRLEALGVNTIDPNNPDDMAALEEVMHENSDAYVQSVPAPPDLAQLAAAYTLQQYNGNVTVNGVSYPFSYIYVTDNKGYSNSTLTHSQTTNVLVGKKNTLLRDLLDYSFTFGISAYLGQFPQGWIADWTLGTVFTILNYYDEDANVTYSGNNNIYNMSLLSVTQMMYVYVYVPNRGWSLCGTRAPNISIARAEYWVSNINGNAVSDSKSYPTQTSFTGSAAYTYAQSAITTGNHTIDRIGSFVVNGKDNITTRFTPGFASYPLQLV